MRTPKYRKHSSGQAVVVLNGKSHYLGKFGSAESRQRYDTLMAEWHANGRQLLPRKGLTCAQLVAAFLAHSETIRAPREHHRYRQALRFVLDSYPALPAADFGPMALQQCRGRMVGQQLSHRYITHLVGCIKTCWKWGAARELLPAEHYHGLRALEPLRPNEGRRTEPIRPVPAEHVSAVLERGGLLPPVRAIVELLRLTGARPSEILAMRAQDISMTSDIWEYSPIVHKNAWRGRNRTVFLGPRAQLVVAPFLRLDLGACLFSPREACQHLAELQGRAFRPGRSRQPGEKYTVFSLRQAIRRACLRAGVPVWTPYQLRHSVGTQIVATDGWDAARVVLGQYNLDTTRIYGEDDANKARELARRIG